MKAARSTFTTKRRARLGLVDLVNGSSGLSCRRYRVSLTSAPRGSIEKPIEPTLAQLRLIDLYRAVRATSGACLDADQRSDGLLNFVLGQLDEEFRRHERGELSQNLSAIILLGMKSHGRA